MRKLFVVFGSLACSTVAMGQMGRSLDWPSFANDNQRTGWEKLDPRFTKDTVAKDFQFLWKMKPSGGGQHTLMPPVLIGTLIGYRGFKELAFIGDTNGALHVMDSDLNRLYWDKKFDYMADVPKAAATATCTGGMAAPTLLSIGFRRPGPPRPAAATVPGAPPPRPTPNLMFGPRAIYVITSDGRLRKVNAADGSDVSAPVAVLPANAKISALNMNDQVIYATTNADCGGAANAVWAVDIGSSDKPAVKSFESKGGNFGGMGGPVIGNDGTIYAQGGAGDSLLALTARDLQLKGTFQVPGGLKSDVTPVVFAYKNRDVIVTAGKDGRLYIADSAAMGGEPLGMSDVVGGSVWGGLTSWAEPDGTRWVLASSWGPVGDTKNGAVVAFKLEEQGGKAMLKKTWTSQDLIKPVPSVTTNGVVFALSSGDAATRMKAVVYALDATTGKELWSSKNQMTAAGNLTGMTIANGRLYVGTVDSTMWVFGVPMEW